MKIKQVVVSWLVLAIVALAILSCSNPLASSNSKGGSLSIQLSNRINARTLVPPIDMTAASFTVSGAGPGGAAFFQTTDGAPVTVTGLAFGSWSVTVNAVNADGTVIGSGQATVTVHTGQTTAVAISVVPLSGNGTLNLTVTWTASQVEIPSIQAILTPSSGPPSTLNFSVSGTQATCSSTTMPAGYQTLTLQLLDNNAPVMGAVDVVRIVAGQTTTGTYAFTNVNQPGGSVVVNITPALADPIPVTISGIASTLEPGTITATASVGDSTANVIYVWYLNGISRGTGSVFSSSLAAGFYRLDVTAYTADGTRAGSATVSFQVTANGTRYFAYVANYYSNNVSAFSIGADGTLTELKSLGSPFAAGSGPTRLAVTPDGSFLYVANQNGNTSSTVSAYSIGPNGALTELKSLGSPFAAGNGPYAVVVSPNGAFLYVMNYIGGENNGTITSFSIGSNGALTSLGSPVATGRQPLSEAISPNGSFLYVTSSINNIVSAYSVGSNGVLTSLPALQVSAPAVLSGVSVSPNGSFLYVINSSCDARGNGEVLAYAIGPDGALTELTGLGSPFAAGYEPSEVVISPNGSFLYTTSTGGNTVAAFSIGSNGALTRLTSSPFTDSSGPVGVAVGPDGSFLYTANLYTNNVAAFSIGSSGALTSLGATLSSGNFPMFVAIARRLR